MSCVTSMYRLVYLCFNIEYFLSRTRNFEGNLLLCSSNFLPITVFCKPRLDRVYLCLWRPLLFYFKKNFLHVAGYSAKNTKTHDFFFLNYILLLSSIMYIKKLDRKCEHRTFNINSDVFSLLSYTKSSRHQNMNFCPVESVPTLFQISLCVMQSITQFTWLIKLASSCHIYWQCSHQD